MRQITLDEAIVRNEDFEGRKATEADYDYLLDEDAIVQKPDGSLLCVVLKKGMDADAMKSAWGVLQTETFVSRNRGVASGEQREHYVKKDGSISNTHIADPVNSGIIGFFERTPRFPYCRACAWNLENPEKWTSLLPMIQDADRLMKLHARARYDLQAKAARLAHKDFLIPGTNFSTLTVNKNFRTAYHRDAGNIQQGVSCMTVFRAGKWSGANLVFPKFRVAAKLDSRDLIIFDPHEVHGNTPYIPLTPNAVRCSVVFYFREKIQSCASAQEELQMVQNRKQGEQLFKTITRKKADEPTD